MDDPKRLAADGASDLELRLLRSWKNDGPSPAAKAAAATLVAGAGMGISGAAAKGAVAAPKFVGLTSASTLMKVTAALVLSSGIVASGVYVASTASVHERFRPRGTSVVSQPTETMPRVPVALASVSVEPTAAKTVSKAPAVVAPLKRPTSERSTKSATRVHAAPPTAPADASNVEAPVRPSRAPSGLGDEVVAIDAARAALKRGIPTECLRLLGEYDRLHENGVMQQEATLLRVESLLEHGDRAGARDVAARFAAAHPTSPHVTTMRRLLRTDP